MTFRSAVDRWLYLVLAAAAVVVVVSVAPLVASASPGPISVALFASAIGIGLPLWILRSTFYTVHPDVLEVRSGPFRWRISRSDITSVEVSHSILSSPALSLNRLRIRYGNNRSVLVSPADREGFLQALGVRLSAR